MQQHEGELKPCPACGGRLISKRYDALSGDSSFDYVGCEQCDLAFIDTEWGSPDFVEYCNRRAALAHGEPVGYQPMCEKWHDHIFADAAEAAKRADIFGGGYRPLYAHPSPQPSGPVQAAIEAEFDRYIEHFKEMERVNKVHVARALTELKRRIHSALTAGKPDAPQAVPSANLAAFLDNPYHADQADSRHIQSGAFDEETPITFGDLRALRAALTAGGGK